MGHTGMHVCDVCTHSTSLLWTPLALLCLSTQSSRCKLQLTCVQRCQRSDNWHEKMSSCKWHQMGLSCMEVNVRVSTLPQRKCCSLSVTNCFLHCLKLIQHPHICLFLLRLIWILLAFISPKTLPVYTKPSSNHTSITGNRFTDCMPYGYPTNSVHCVRELTVISTIPIW